VGDVRLAYLRETLAQLEIELKRLKIPLRIEAAPTFADAPGVLLRVLRDTGARALYSNAEYPFNEMQRDAAVARACADSGVRFEQRHGGLILPPGSVLTAAGSPYTVFTPFKRRWLETLTPDDYTPLPAPRTTPQRKTNTEPPAGTARAAALATLPVLPADPDWPAGEVAARQRLTEFLDTRITGYASNRDFPHRHATSRLSAHLAIGSLSARSALAAARERNGGRLNAKPGPFPGIDTWISELIWREFYRHVVALFPHVSRGQAFHREFDRLQWRQDPGTLDAWKAGATGYPLVDAAMRQLAQTGFMHNRLRMVSAMFLSKHLLIDWREGERHFMQHLRDGDFASNNGGWQWSASTGTDAAPYFRIFNPGSQMKKFDPDGSFVRRFVPESLAPADGLFADSDAASAAANAGPYPAPIVDHRFARQRALDFFKSKP
ncbi:MAG: deoxyribodipyrimidine photo-lyase, partial [Pseudomonadales bacterium]|nr:deoxyribodipyrimidine photo-lyase [Pseudomonadales bacterium]